MKLFDPFGNPLLIKRVMFGVFGSFFYIGLCVINRLRIEGSDKIRKLPAQNVLFVSGVVTTLEHFNIKQSISGNS